MSRRIRTIGGTGVGASTSTAAITAATIEWGPNFGSTRQFAQEGHIASSVAADATKQLIGEELLRPVSYAGSYPMLSESEMRVDNLLDIPVDPLFHEQTMTRSNIGNTSAGMTQEGTVAGTNFAEPPVQTLLSEGAVRMLSQTAEFPMILEHFKRIGELIYINYTPVHEAGVIDGSFEAVFFDSGEWIVPGGVTTYTGFVWGGGGGGGDGGALNGGTGGGGGAFSLATGLTGTPGTTVTVSISIGTTGVGADSFIASTLDVMAKGGNRGQNNGSGGGGGGSSAQGVGTLKFSGGGGNGNSGGQGGGGGGGAGTSASGGASGSTAGGIGGANFGGNGGRGGNASQNGGAGALRSGGGGAGGALGTGGVSGRGQASILFPVV